MVKVTLNGKIVYAQEGALLSEVLAESGSRAEHPCGGKGLCKKCMVKVNGKEELSCRYVVSGDIDVITPDNKDVFSPVDDVCLVPEGDDLFYALDIGTTTLALALVSRDRDGIVKTKACTNPQRIYGADVISRIEYCTKNGTDDLKNVLINSVNSLIAFMGVEKDLKMYVTGNTTMLHLFFGVDCSTLGVAPYTPQFLCATTQSGQKLGLKGVEEAESLPSISSFAGADVLAGIYLAGEPADNSYSLLVDLGTNAEIALFSKEKIICTSAAAGPCFEGVNISCGMSAVEGAIYEYKNGKYKTVGNELPKGICGTGLVDIVADFCENKIIDETGYMKSEQTDIAPGVYVTAEDIRQYQLAKSAVYSGILTLLKENNVLFDNVGHMFISGGFSGTINVRNAVKTGLLPKELQNKWVVLNNSSLQGCVKYALKDDDLTHIINKAEYRDLSCSDTFSRLFIENMGFEG